MTKKEFVDRNIGMTFDFIRQVVAEPSLAGSMRAGAEIDFVDKDAPVMGKVGHQDRQVMLFKVEHVFEPVKGVIIREKAAAFKSKHGLKTKPLRRKEEHIAGHK
jgi:hypothetical protein